ncbi:MAG: hypothetical protein WBK95_06855, partial [Sulfurimonas sp.]
MVISFAGCSGSGGSDSTTTTSAVLESGQFIDAPVEGLGYECSSSRSGTTDSSGTFTCQQGDSVTFKVGNVVIG